MMTPDRPIAAPVPRLASAGSGPVAVRGLVPLLGALTALGALSIDTYIPGLPAMAAELHTSASDAQLTITACLIGLGVGQLLGGPASDALGRRRPLLLGLGLYVLASLLCALAPSIWLVVALRLLQGVGGAIGIVIANAVVRDRQNGGDAGKTFSLLMLISGVVPILAPVLGGQILRVTTWPGIFVALGVAAALLGAAVVLALPETLPADRRRGGGLRATTRTFVDLGSERAFLGCMLGCGLSFAAMFAYIAGSSFTLQDIHHVSPQTYSVIFGSNAVGLVIAAQVGGHLSPRAGPGALLRAGVAGSAAGGTIVLLSVLAGNNLPLLLLGMFTVVASVGLTLPNSMALALQGNADHAGSAAALMGLATYFTGALSAPFAGVAGAHTALPMAVTITVCGAAALSAVLLLVPRTGSA